MLSFLKKLIGIKPHNFDIKVGNTVCYALFEGAEDHLANLAPMGKEIFVSFYGEWHKCKSLGVQTKHIDVRTDSNSTDAHVCLSLRILEKVIDPIVIGDTETVCYQHLVPKPTQRDIRSIEYNNKNYKGRVGQEYLILAYCHYDSFFSPEGYDKRFFNYVHEIELLEEL